MTARLVQLHTDEQRATIHAWRTAAEKWLKAQGLDQFQPDGPSDAWRAHLHIDEAFDAGQFLGLEVDGELMAVSAIKDPDPDFWTPEERAQPQVYLARSLVGVRGQGYGRHLRALIGRRAQSEGIPRMRLDCWRTNTQLQAYYASLGYRHVGTVVVEGRGSGYKMELDLTRPSPLLPETQNDPTP